MWLVVGGVHEIRDPSRCDIKSPSTHIENQVFLPVPDENFVCASIAMDCTRDREQ